MSPRRWGLVAGGVCLAVAAAPGAAPATTGPGAIEARPPQFRIPQTTTDLYLGGYQMQRVDPSSHILMSNMTIEEPTGSWGLFTGGIIQFYGYDTNGHEESWVATLYDFRQLGNPTKIFFNILDTDSTRLGSLTLQRLPNGSLAGVLDLPRQINAYNQNGYPGTYAILYRKVSSGKPPVSVRGAHSNGPRGYETFGAASPGTPAAPKSPAAPKTPAARSGWSDAAGRYRLASATVVSSPSTTPTSADNAGIFSGLVQRALRAVAGRAPTTGRLDVKRGSGRLSLTSPGSSQTMRLARLRSQGSSETAQVVGAAGDVEGDLQLTRAGGRLTGTLTLQNSPLLHVTFTR